jgi:hypothetical protein
MEEERNTGSLTVTQVAEEAPTQGIIPFEDFILCREANNTQIHRTQPGSEL